MAPSRSTMSTAEPTPLDTAQMAARRASVAAAVEAASARALAELDGPVADAIRYALAGEGKRLRAVLLLSAYDACGGTGDATGLAAAVEIVHAYSLVHDDLPCMDNDDLRRGRPTVHRAFDVPTATAAGVAMVPLAVRTADHAARVLGLGSQTRGAIVRTLMVASGAGGMVGGQLLDLDGEAQVLSLAELERIHRLKTGALIEASVAIGALAALATADQLEALRRYGRSLGLAFQIADDVLDVTSTSAELGKTAGKDLAFQKSTYPALLGIPGATAWAQALIGEGVQALRGGGIDSPALEALARFVVERRN
ncbi:MAG: polyprenyl synthetase family protein [Gemmatimonadaceae bacterium]|nr:polyprenyl synthetase family protein [Gemmatimonadaceae bacterium]